MTNPLDVWKDGSLINHEAINSAPPEVIEQLSKILDKLK